MLKFRNKKMRTVLASMLATVMIFNSQPITTYSAPVEIDTIEETYEGVEVTVETDVIKLAERAVTNTTKSVEIEELPIIEESVGEQSSSPLSEAEIDLIAIITMAEAEGESEYGKRLVIDTILNRVDSSKFPNNVRDVIYQKNQFEPTWNGRMDRCYVKDDIRQLVLEELVNRTNHEVMFFRGGKFSSYGTPMFQEGNHYFNKL